MKRRLLLAAGMMLVAVGPGALAQNAPPSRIRGTVGSVNGNVLSVKSRDGSMIDVTMPDALAVGAVKKVELSAIPVGSFIGTATRSGPGGTNVAIEVLVFPEAARGTGEGNYPWDLEPGSMMTNGTIKGEVAAASGQELSISYKDSGNKVVVPPGTPVVTFAPAAREDLKAGAKVFVVAKKEDDGKMTALRVVVEKDGVAPPM